MNKRILLTFIVVLAVALSAGTIYASDVNVTDSYASADDTSLEISESSSEITAYESGVDNVLESESSNSLSTNTEDSNLSKNDDNALSAIDVSKTITSKDVTKYYKGSKKYTATFLDANGNALAKTNVKIAVKGQNYTKTTDSKGVASLDINLKPGSYKVVATNPATGYQLTTNFKILTTISAKDISKVYSDRRKFYATFLNSNGKALANKNVKFKISGKTYTVKTNTKGVASLSLTTLKPGTFKIISYNTDGLTKTNKVTVVKYSTTTLTAYDYTFLSNKKKVIKVRLLNQFGYAPGAGKIIKFAVNGKIYTSKTNSNGYAKLTLPALKNGVYTVKYKFAGNHYYKASTAKSTVTIIPSKTPTFTVKSTTTFGYGAGTSFKVALTSGTVPLAGKTVTLKVDGKTYTKTTDRKGIVSLPINLAVGKYTITYTNKAESKINSKTGSSAITVKERTKTSLKWESGSSIEAGTKTLKLLLADSSKKAISGETVKLTIYSKTYSAKTSTSGYATFSIKLQAGNTTASYSFAGDNSYLSSSGSVKLNVHNPTTVSMKNVLAASASLKSYYEKNSKLPSTVTVGEIKYSLPEFLYMMSQAIVQLESSNKKDMTYVSGVSAPKSPSGDVIKSKSLTEAKYVALAKNVANYIKTNKAAPNYAASDIGKIIYSEVVDSFSRILTFYKTNNRLPSYVTIIYDNSGTGQGGTGLNEKNTATDLSAYLKSTKNCQVNNTAIKKIVNTLTKGLKTDKEKATAIYNYVRDTVGYSFYYNTKYGAAGTLSSKKGNCVDHTHLLVAMYRTAGIAARYVHGTCTFSSGSTYGHVWAQVLINGQWTVSDATSSRNSLGHISNWNTKSFTLKGIYSGISF